VINRCAPPLTQLAESRVKFVLRCSFRLQLERDGRFQEVADSRCDSRLKCSRTKLAALRYAVVNFWCCLAPSS